MGLFSSIKQIYNDYRLNNAIKLVDNKDYNQAEAIFIDLIPKHPEAVTQLSNMYLIQAEAQSDLLRYYKKALDCDSKLIFGVSNKKSFEESKSNVLNLIYQHFNDNNSKRNYKKALEFSSILINYDKTENFIVKHYRCLFDSAVILNDTQSKEAELILIQIYKDCKNKSFLSEIINYTVNQIFSRAQKYSTLKKYDSSNYLCSFILVDKLEAKYLYIENDILNVELIKTKGIDVAKLLDIIKSLNNKTVAIKYLESLLNHILETKTIYSQYNVELSNALIKSKKYKEAITLLNNAFLNYNDSIFIEQLITISNLFIDEKNYNSAIELLDNLISKHPDAEPLLAKCYLELSSMEKSNDLKKDLLLKALEFKNKHNNLFNAKLYEQVFLNVISSLIDVSYKYGEFSYYSDAYTLLDTVLSYEPLSINTFIKVKVLEINSISTVEKQIKLYKEAIDTVKQKIIGIIDIKSIQFDILYVELINTSLKKFSHSDQDIAIHELVTIKKGVVKNKIQSTILDKAIYKLDVEIVERYYNKGVELEKQNQTEDAFNCFEIIIDQYSNVSDVFNLSLLRKHILLLKNYSISKIAINNDSIIKLLETQKRNKVVIDLAYRFAIHLIKNGFYDLTDSIIENYLPSSSNSVVFLKELCKNENIKKSKNVLSELNLKIEKINSGELAASEAIQILSNLGEIEKKCSALDDTDGKIIDIKKNLIDYIIFKSFEDENYVDSFNCIKKYRSNYINDEILFRNIAISSLGIVTNGSMNNENYKELISIWVTAIYNDILFIHTLNYTSWDDKFTFSLQNSLGCLLEEDAAQTPQNVNNDDPDETNISIGEVQKSLLQLLEQTISKSSYDDNIKITSLEFLAAEIDAITSLYRLELDDQIMGCTPYFAHQNNELYEKIVDSLINELRFSDINTENVLRVGLLYNTNRFEFKEYSDSIILKNKAIEVVKNINNSQTKLILTKQNTNKIKRYDELYTSFCNEIRDIFKVLINDEDNYEMIITNYLIVCNALSDANLNYMVSNSANRICISKLNKESINKDKGLKILADVYEVIKDNDKLNENLQAVLNSAAIEIIIEGSTILKNVFYKIIDKSANSFDRGIIDTLNDTVENIIRSGKIVEFKTFSRDFNSRTNLKSALNSVILKADEVQVNLELSNIIEKLNSGSTSEIQGLKLTYELYKSNKNHKRVCENLVIICGNLIHSNVIKKTLSTNQVTIILDDLNKNKSAVFVQCAIELSNQRSQILKNLPIETKKLVVIDQIMFNQTQTLTPEGEALKRGLKYLEKLSSIYL